MFGSVFTVRAGDYRATSPETTAKGHQFANPNDNLLVLELASPLGLFLLAERVIKRHEQAIARRVNVLAGDDLAFDQAFFSDVFIGPIRYD